MALRKANAYSKRNVTPFTRVSKRRKKAFIKVVPPSKVVKFTMGKTKEHRDGKYPYQLKVICMENVQIRNNAIEACRQYINKKLTKELAGQFMFKIVPFPHHIQRENKMLTGAGADRMQTGMQLSFGKSMNKAAIMKENKELFIIAVGTKKGLAFSRKTVKETKAKLPCKIRIVEEVLETQ